jgi:hypothetical protein
MRTPVTPTSRSAEVLLAVALILALALAGCGGSSSPGVAHVGATNASSTSSGPGGGTPEASESSTANQQTLVKFAQCMRTHGEPEFPEPSEGHILIHNHNGSGPNPESPRFQAAEKACKKYAPTKVAPSPAQRAKIEEQALKFSECMRHHGVPNFPDPQFPNGGGAVRLKVGKSSGIEPGSPQFQAAQKACQSDLPSKAQPGFHAGGPPGGGAQSSGAVAAP